MPLFDDPHLLPPSNRHSATPRHPYSYTRGPPRAARNREADAMSSDWFLQVRHAFASRGPAARRGHRRARRAGLQLDVVRVPGHGPRGGPVQPRRGRAHLLADLEPDGRRVRGTDRGASRAASARWLQPPASPPSTSPRRPSSPPATTSSPRPRSTAAPHNLLNHTLRRFGIETTFVEPTDPRNFQRAARPNTKLFFGETIGNPRASTCWTFQPSPSSPTASACRC